ncbi:hypothetical protein D3C76_525320 [compost metagenome]
MLAIPDLPATTEQSVEMDDRQQAGSYTKRQRLVAGWKSPSISPIHATQGINGSTISSLRLIPAVSQRHRSRNSRMALVWYFCLCQMK